MIQSKHKAKIQPKLTIGQPNDSFEQEADQVADAVMTMPGPASPLIQRKCEACEEEELQMKPLAASMAPMIQKQEEEEEEALQMKGSGNAGSTSTALQSSLRQSKGGGQSMDTVTQSFMGDRMGADFSNVKIHTNENAVQMNRQLNARAFTNGSDVYFNKGEYNPQSAGGKHLLAHELTHAVQQGSVGRIQKKATLEVNPESALANAAGNVPMTKVGQPGRIGARIYGTKIVTQEVLGFEYSEEVDEDNYSDIVSKGKKIYKANSSKSGVSFYLKYNQLVDVVGVTSDDWAFIASPSGNGWVQKQYVHYPTPDLKSELHFVKSGELLKDVISSYYSGQGVDLNTWGEDTRFYVHAVALANEGKKGISYYDSKKDLSLFREIFLDETGEESQRIWNSAYLLKGHNIWLPSLDLIAQMKSMGVVSAGSVSYTAYETLKDYLLFNIGLNIGVFEGLWAAFVDTLTGIVDLVKLIGTLIEKIINGELIDYLLELWEGLKKTVSGLGDTLKKAWEEFMAKSAFDKGRAVGKVVGMILFEVLLAYFTAGAVSAIKWSGKAGKLASAFRKMPDIDLNAQKITKKVDPPDAATKQKIKDHVEQKSTPDTDVPDADTPTPDATKPTKDLSEYKAGDRLEPNTTYTERGYKYTTNEHGRVTKVEGELELKDPNRKRKSSKTQTDVGKLGKKKSGSSYDPHADEGGHLVGDRFEGSSNINNLAPQNANLNRGKWKSMENEWANAIKDGKKVEVEIEVIYDGNTVRPDKFYVKYEIDGVPFEREFYNNKGGLE